MDSVNGFGSARRYWKMVINAQGVGKDQRGNIMQDVVGDNI